MTNHWGGWTIAAQLTPLRVGRLSGVALSYSSSGSLQATVNRSWPALAGVLALYADPTRGIVMTKVSSFLYVVYFGAHRTTSRPQPR